MTEIARAAVDARILHGYWELVSWDRVDPAGAVTYPFGREPRGRIFYDPNGRMSAILMNPAWAKGDVQGHGFVAYSGTYELQGDVVHHAVDMCSDPGFVGLTLRRRVVIEGEGVVLETLAALGLADRDSKHRLTWRRA